MMAKLAVSFGTLVHASGGFTAAGFAEHVYWTGRVAPSVNPVLVIVSGGGGGVCGAPPAAGWPCRAIPIPAASKNAGATSSSEALVRIGLLSPVSCKFFEKSFKPNFI